MNTNMPFYPGWETVKKIGTGSFGAVYEIERELFGKKEKAALKLVSIPQSESDIEELYSNGYDDESITAHFNDCLADIVREYTLMVDMKGHTNVVYCDDIRYVQKDDGFGWDIYIKMELLTSLTKVVDSSFSEEQVIKIGADICNALVICKSRSIIHRDIKPQNIFVSKDGDYKLGDFGIAKTVEKTSGGTKIGTYNYMAPEVYNNSPYGHTADIYSLGLVLYWLMNERRMPFNPLPPAVPKSSDMDNARFRRFSGELLPAPAHGSDELKRIVLRACAYDPKDRYQSAADMLNDLEMLGTPKHGRAEPIIILPLEPTIESEQENPADGTVGLLHDEMSDLDDKTMGVFPKQEDTEQYDFTVGAAGSLDNEVSAPDDETVGIFPKKKKEPEPDEGKTMGVWTPPESETRVASKPKKKPKIWIRAAAMALAVIGGTVGIMISTSPKQEASTAKAPTIPEQAAQASQGENAAKAPTIPEQAAQASQGENAAKAPTIPEQTDKGNDVAMEELVEVKPCAYEYTLYATEVGTVGLKSNGTPVCTEYYNSWGGFANDMDLTDLVAVSSGRNYLVGLKENGTVVTTWHNYGGNESDWTDIIAISAASDFTIGLKSDGTVVASGSNTYGRCKVTDWTDIVAVSAGTNHTVGLKSNSTVVATGNNSYGQCNVSDWGGVIAISAGENHTVGLKTDGTVISVGINHDGRCDVSGWEDIIAVSAGEAHTVGLKADGTVIAVGSNSYGQCNVSGWTDIVAISAGNGHTVGLKSNGTVVAAGNNSDGQCDVSDWTNIMLPK